MGRFLVDTSVWIDFFRGALTKAAHKTVTEGIRLDLVSITDVIRHEVLVGAGSESHYKILSRLLQPLQCLRIADGDLAIFDKFAWDLKMKGLKGKYSDLSIAFIAMRHSLPVFAFDDYFRRLSRKEILQTLT